MRIMSQINQLYDLEALGVGDLEALGVGGMGKKNKDEDEEQQSSTNVIPCARELKDAEISFKKKRNERNLVNVTFESGIMEIPRLIVDDSTAPLFKNLVALKQVLSGSKKFFTTYAMLMHGSVTSSEDVALLREEGVVENVLGNDEKVVVLFSQLCRHAYIDWPSVLNEGVKAYCGRKWNERRSHLVHYYFHSPRSILSMLAAFLGLFLTTLGVYYSVMSYYFPRKNKESRCGASKESSNIHNCIGKDCEAEEGKIVKLKNMNLMVYSMDGT